VGLGAQRSLRCSLSKLHADFIEVALHEHQVGLAAASGANQELTFSPHDHPVWSMRSWESVAPKSWQRRPDSHGRMDQTPVEDAAQWSATINAPGAHDLTVMDSQFH
jgi:hypothetical protein